ncbi:ANTAR domain-containing protein [Streptomyces panaciradicis]|uniref:ANTAR domain-containing protein n=1 Tax=Streptomyces panaciradicis TaxID=1470261 RepID=UPI00201CFB14|nr:ANTAR domain-containing protein [Streptomyces panaciradicis]MCL6670051.1 ANTAR domain-containing protein [Streptomyces panaciradicis]
MPESADSAQPLTAQESPGRSPGDGPRAAVPCLAAIESVTEGDRALVTVHGELDVGGAGLRTALGDVLDRSATGIDLDLTAVGFCDCGGLNLLLDLRRQALDRGKTVGVRAWSPAVARLFELTGTRELFTPSAPGGRGAVAVAEAPVRRADADQELRTEVAQLRRAMRTRPVIDVARGILMASFGLSADAAWAVLVTASQNSNTKLHQLAQDLMGAVDGSALSAEVRQRMADAVALVRERQDGTRPSV